MSEIERALKRLRRFEEKAKGHRARVRERFWKEGPQSFSEEDLLELLLFFGIPRKDTRAIARELLKTFGGRIDLVIDAPVEELIKIKGLGEAGILPLKVVQEVAHRYLKSRIKDRDYLRSPEEVYNYLMYRFKNHSREVFVVLFLDTHNRVIEVEELFSGTVNESAVYPREIFAKAVKYRAYALIFAHNHPSGRPVPSSADLRLTKKLILAGNLLGFKVLDHLIIGSEGYYSMAEKGDMERLFKEVLEEVEARL
jgi:DNA repair protein RadC